ncbi:MAG: NADH-quinone oxidoreductase subunit NuoN [Burkholderiaceae bacterium]|nr:NADH-quinone oxidoreductase subunit NuoN [Burkholderiaceae bacterium]
MQFLGLLIDVPEIVLLAAACGVLLVDLFVSDARRNITYGLTMAALLVVAVFVCVALVRQDTVIGFGTMYVGDPMGHVLKLAAILCCGFMLVCAQSYARARGLWKGELFSLTLFTLLGIMLMISANNLLVIYLGLELQSLSMYALVALRRDDPRSSEAAMKYFVLGSLASGFLLYGMSMLYGATGTLEIDQLARQVAADQVSNRAVLLLGVVFVIAGLAFKFGIVPFHMWAPDVYQGAPTPITLLLSSAPELAIFAIAFRILVDGLLPLALDWQKILALLAVASLVLGNLTAIAQTNLKRMLAYSTIAQMGFVLLAMLSGVAAGDPGTIADAYSAAMFYLITYALTSLGTFGIILLLSRQGFEAEEIADFRGLAKRSPWYAFIMLVLMFSLAGVPPTVGFYAKLVVLQALLSEGATVAALSLSVIAVLFSLIAAFYYLRIVKTMYFDEPLPDVAAIAIVAPTDMRVALSLNAILILVLGIAPQYLLQLCADAMARSLGG